MTSAKKIPETKRENQREKNNYESILIDRSGVSEEGETVRNRENRQVCKKIYCNDDDDVFIKHPGLPYGYAMRLQNNSPVAVTG